MECQQFLEIDSRDKLAQWLGLTDRKLRYLLYKLSPDDRYTTFSIKKRNGSDRRIDAPKQHLKSIQRKINKALQIVAPPSGLAKGFVPTLSIADHARLHERRRWVVVADIADFFPSINFGRVLGAFRARPFLFPYPVALCLAQLCCYEARLPQGAPTSPALSNLICRALDRNLLKLAKRNRVTVSRYGDDLCFSSNILEIPSDLAVRGADGSYAPSPALLEIFVANGFSLNLRKFRVRWSFQSQMVTGLIVNRAASMPRVWKRQLRVILHLLQRYDAKECLRIVSSWGKRGLRNGNLGEIENLVRGKAHFAKWLDDLSGTRFVESLHRGYPKHRALLPRVSKGFAFRIMTEGDSDAIHLQTALKHFKSIGHFDELVPRFENYAGDKGDVDLLQTLKRIAKADIYELVVGVFDCDNETFMRSNAAASGSVVRLGRMVFAVFLAAPAGTTGRFCIESLYSRSEATRLTSDERRLFFGDEFDARTGLDASGTYRRQTPKNTSVVLSDKVERVSDGKSSLLSKMDFAKLVSVGAAPFSDMNFDGFRPTFLLVRSIFDSV